VTQQLQARLGQPPTQTVRVSTRVRVSALAQTPGPKRQRQRRKTKNGLQLPVVCWFAGFFFQPFLPGV
jgi:hypothetical protein